MSLLTRIKKKENKLKQANDYFNMINGYAPAFTSFEGGMYEQALTRAIIHTFATHVSRFKPVVSGSGNVAINKALQYRPCPTMDTKKYLYRLATGYEMDNNVLIAPLADNKGNICGYYPMVSPKCRQFTENGQVYIEYTFKVGSTAIVPLAECGLLNKMQYKDELYGESNRPMQSTLELIDIQEQGIEEGIKNAAAIRFMAKLASVLDDEDIETQRKSFRENNFKSSNNGGVMMFDSRYEDVKQIDSKAFIVNPAQVSQIKENAFNYFGINEDVLQNKFSSDGWSSYYEGKLEPFALELGLVHTGMTFTDTELSYGNDIMFTSNRFQYMTPIDKLSVVTQLFDRGFMTHNMGLEIFNMDGIGPEGDKRYIRKEYSESNNLDKGVITIE